MHPEEISAKDVREISEEIELESNEEIELTKNVKTLQLSNLARYKYLLKLRRWTIFQFVHAETILQIHMAMIFPDQWAFFVTRDKNVYGFGNNTDNHLGIDERAIILPPRKIEPLCGKNIKKFACNREWPHMFALTEEGEVYSWGNAEKPGLGHALNFKDSRVKNSVTIPTQISLLNKIRIIDIKCSVSHSLALTHDGKVYIWGYISMKDKRHMSVSYSSVDKPRVVQFNGTKIVEIACGRNFSLARSDEGKLYSWGLSTSGVLGINIEARSLTDIYPTQITESISNEIIDKVVCGTSHALALTNKGMIYSWGNNKTGALGIQALPDTMYPKLVKIQSKRVKDIAIGQGDSDSNIALCDDKCIYMWGFEIFGQDCMVPYITSFLNINEALISYNNPLTIFAEDLKYMSEENNLIYMLKKDESIDEEGESIDEEDESIDEEDESIDEEDESIDEEDESIIEEDESIDEEDESIDEEGESIDEEDESIDEENESMYEPRLIDEGDEFKDKNDESVVEKDKYIDEELDILDSWETLFDDPFTYDLIIKVKHESIHVHKAILMSRSSYFKTKFQNSPIGNKGELIENPKCSYKVYKAYLKYLYVDAIIDLSMKELVELLDLATTYQESKLEKYCIQEIKKKITIQNVSLLYNIVVKSDRKDLTELCCQVALNDKEAVKQSEYFNQLDIDKRNSFLNAIDEFESRNT